MGWGGVNFLLLLFSAVQDISWTFDFFYPLKFPLRPPQVGGGIFFIDFLDSSWNLPDFLHFYPHPPPPEPPPPGVGWVKKQIFDAGA